MAELTNDQQARIKAAVAEALQADAVSAPEAAIHPEGIGDVKNLFCNNWPTVKAVLQFLSGYLPALLRVAISTIIASGDKVHAAICG
ncbi:MAG: hypothetical protein WDN44_09725 [Sphingomonas sp.]